MADEYKLPLAQIKPVMIPEDVLARKGNKSAWPVLLGVSIAQVEIPVGKWRAPHYHTNAAELSIIVQGTARAGLITPQNELITIELREGECVYFPTGWAHWLRNTGDIAVKTYFNYGNEQPITVEIPNVIEHFSAREKEVSLRGRTGFTETE
jgi:mannose-6-phosphate isomerase-like protein (cupin superfamily)